MSGGASSRGVRPVDLDSTAVITLGRPDVRLAGDEIVVTARLWNEGSFDAQSQASCELVRDGRIVDTAVSSIEVPAQTAFTFTQKFALSGGRRGTHTARVNSRRTSHLLRSE